MHIQRNLQALNATYPIRFLWSDFQVIIIRRWLSCRKHDVGLTYIYYKGLVFDIIEINFMLAIL
jgi:hypothetical protein